MKSAELKREVERGSTFTLTSDLSCIASISFANLKFYARTHARTRARAHVKITRHWKSTLGQLKLLTQYSSFKFTVMEKGEKSGKTLDCEQSLFFFRCSKGSARAREC